MTDDKPFPHLETIGMVVLIYVVVFSIVTPISFLLNGGLYAAIGFASGAPFGPQYDCVRTRGDRFTLLLLAGATCVFISLVLANIPFLNLNTWISLATSAVSVLFGYIGCTVVAMLNSDDDDGFGIDDSHAS